MTLRNEWPLHDHQPGHEALYYAVIDLKGRILSMNTAMDAEFGPRSNRHIEHFQELLPQHEQPAFVALLQAARDCSSALTSAALYAYPGVDRGSVIRWSFFSLVADAAATGTILCAGYSYEVSSAANDAAVLTQDRLPAAMHTQETTISPSQLQMLLKILDNERLLIGQELHDNVNQLLCTAKLHLDMLRVVKADNVEAKKTSVELIVEAIDGIRNLSKGLVLQQLKRDTLLESIHTFIEDFKTFNQIQVVFGTHHFNEDRLSGTKKINIFRIIQEQFRNITQHSHAKTVVMTLETDDKNIELIIDDDGIGFDPNMQMNGVGLINIRERTKLLNGHCDIITAPGHGCRLHILIPLK